MTEETRHPASTVRGDDVPAMRQMVLDSVGGWRGFADSALPAAAFVAANLIGGLEPAIWAGGICGVLIFVFRLLRRQSVQQAVAGLIGVGICIFIARQTGEARGFFVFGIVRSGILALVLAGSMLLRWPLIGVVWSFLSPSAGSWRDDVRAMRTFQWLTAAWALGFGAKFAIEGYFYLIDAPTGLGAVRIVLGYPLTIGLLLLTFLMVNRMRADQRRATEPPSRRDAPAP